MRQRERRLALIIGTVAWLISRTGEEASAQTSKLLEFGPYTIEMAEPARAAKQVTLGALVEPGAGRWQPWVLASGRDLRLPPPPDDRATAREQRELRKLAVGDDAAALERIRYWDSGSPAHRWNERLAEIMVREDAGNTRTHAFALVNIAIHDALIAAWDSKYAYKRPRPSELDARLVPEVTVPRSPAYPCEHAVAAGAAAGILAHLFPARAESLAAAAHEAAWSRVVAGAVYPSDSKAGLALGRAVAARVIRSVKADEALSFGVDPDLDPREDAQVSIHRRLNEEIGRRLTGAALDGNAPRAARIYALAHVAYHAAFIAARAGTSRTVMVRPYRFGFSLVAGVPIPACVSQASGAGEVGLAAALVLDHLLPSEVSRHPRWTGEAGELRAGAGTGPARDAAASLEIGREVAAAVIERARRDGAE